MVEKVYSRESYSILLLFQVFAISIITIEKYFDQYNDINKDTNNALHIRVFRYQNILIKH